MGTRADFYDGKGTGAEWLGSIAWDGYPSVLDEMVMLAKDSVGWREKVSALLAARDDATVPCQGWPWPWDNSGTTDYAYAFENGKVWISCFGSAWHDESFQDWDEEKEQEIEPPGPPAEFPDMSGSKHSAPAGSKRSGVMMISAPEDPGSA